MEQLLARWAPRSDKWEEQNDNNNRRTAVRKGKKDSDSDGNEDDSESDEEDDDDDDRRTAVRSDRGDDDDDQWIMGLDNETSQCLKDWLEPTEDEKALIEAAEEGDLDAVTMLVKERGVHPDCQKLEEGITPLMAAVRGNNTAVAEFLLQHGAQVEREDLEESFAIEYLRIHNLELEQLFLHYAQGKCFGKRMAEVLEDRRKYLVSCGLLFKKKKKKKTLNPNKTKGTQSAC